jgi:outer membrane lipoprotein-sorting protein
LRYHIFFITFVLSSLLIITAKAASSLMETDPELQNLLSFYKKTERLETNFHQTKKMKGLKMLLNSDGKLVIQKPDQVIWEVQKPARMRAELTQQSIRLETGEGAEKTVQVLDQKSLGERKEAQSLKALKAWLEMDADLLKKDYQVTKLGPSQFLFEPFDKNSSPFEKLEMKISQGKYVQELIISEKSGDQMQISFTAPKVILKK